MPTFSLSILTSNPSSQFPLLGRDFITSIATLLQKNGSGTCHGLATEVAIVAEIDVPDKEAIMPYIHSFVRSLQKSVPSLKMVIEDTIAHPLTPELKSVATAMNMPPAKLTLKYFKSLPEGYFLVSNTFTGPNTPVFSDFVAPESSRMDQWERLKECAVDQRTCHVFPSKAAFEKWRTGWLNHPPV